MGKPIVQWDAYKYIDDYVDEADWHSSFLFTNEYKTLLEDIESKIMQGKMVIYSIIEDKKSKAVCCFNSQNFVQHIVGSLSCDFVITKQNDNVYRLNLMTADLIERTIFINPMRTEARDGI